MGHKEGRNLTNYGFRGEAFQRILGLDKVVRLVPPIALVTLEAEE